MSTSISFPGSPSVGQTYTYGSATYEWDGYRWNLIGELHIVNDTAPQLGGNLGLDNYSIDETSALSSDQTYSGIIETGTVGESVVFGDVLYLKFSDGKWWKAAADVYITTPAQRMALASISASSSGILLVEGNVRNDSWGFVDSKLYLSSSTPGALTSIEPTATGEQIQTIGVAKTSTIIYFKPSLDVGTI